MNHPARPNIFEGFDDLYLRMKRGVAGASDDFATKLRPYVENRTRLAFHASFADLRRDGETADLTQEVMVRLLPYLSEGPPEPTEQFRRRVNVTVWRTLLDLIRKLRGPHGLLRNMKLGGPEVDAAGITSGAVRRDDDIDFRQRLESLDENDAKLIFLRYMVEMDVTEIADVLEKNRKTVRLHLQRILGELGHAAAEQ
jgi:RNA polymerase sigma factor (sigma-70 family)